VEHDIMIDKIQVKKEPKHTNVITLDSNTVIKMKYPGIEAFIEGINLENTVSSSAALCKYISQITMGEETFNRSDMTDEEIQSWVDSLTSKEFDTLIAFFYDMPKLQHEITLTNPKTEKKFTIKLTGLQDFLA
jgi:hypothetical protein